MSESSESPESPAAIATDVRRNLYANNTGALATLGVDSATSGFPFGSVVPYALDETGRPLILISDIAQHTRNLKADPRASLLVRADESGESGGGESDPQATWRITLVGRFGVLADDTERELCHARYVAQVLNARSYYNAHGFALWRMDVVRVRFIGGFGRIHWVEAADYLRPDGHGGFAEAAPGIVGHMNRDHADALLDYCRGLRDVEPSAAEMTGIEAAGFFLRTREPDDLLYFPFGEEITADQARGALIALLKRARSAASDRE